MRRLLAAALILIGGCAPAVSTPTGPAMSLSPDPTEAGTTLPAPTSSSITAPPTTPSTTPPPTTTPSTTLPAGVGPPPVWLGTRPLPLDTDGNPLPASTPPELSDRRLTTVDVLPSPPDDRFRYSVEPVPADVLARSTWTEECPVSPEDLAYVTVTFRGFDGLPHTGELIVAESVAMDMVSAFEAIYAAGFPIEEMRVTSPADLRAPPTGDGNATSAFACRPVTGGHRWSEHAFGLAIDVNPFHNPYLRGELVLPELAGDYLDRARHLPGMITEGDAVTRAFDAIGWEWGGRWSSLKDYQHFSLRGR